MVDGGKAWEDTMLECMFRMRLPSNDSFFIRASSPINRRPIKSENPATSLVLKKGGRVMSLSRSSSSFNFFFFLSAVLLYWILQTWQHNCQFETFPDVSCYTNTKLSDLTSEQNVPCARTQCTSGKSRSFACQADCEDSVAVLKSGVGKPAPPRLEICNIKV